MTVHAGEPLPRHLVKRPTNMILPPRLRAYRRRWPRTHRETRRTFLRRCRRQKSHRARRRTPRRTRRRIVDELVDGFDTGIVEWVSDGITAFPASKRPTVGLPRTHCISPTCLLAPRSSHGSASQTTEWLHPLALSLPVSFSTTCSPCFEDFERDHQRKL